MNKNEKMIQAWKKAEVEMNEKAPVAIDAELMQEINGGAASAGAVCSVSGECNGSGRSCGTVRGIWDEISSRLFGGHEQ